MISDCFSYTNAAMHAYSILSLKFELLYTFHAADISSLWTWGHPQLITLCCMRNMAEIDRFTVGTVKLHIGWIKMKDQLFLPWQEQFCGKILLLVVVDCSIFEGLVYLMLVYSRGKPHIEQYKSPYWWYIVKRAIIWNAL